MGSPAPTPSPVLSKLAFPEGGPASAEARQLLLRLLAVNPAKRISAEEAVKQPFLQGLYDPAELVRLLILLGWRWLARRKGWVVWGCICGMDGEEEGGLLNV